MDTVSAKLAPLVERGLNRYLQADPLALHTTLEPLAGKAIGLTLSAPELQFFFLLKRDKIDVVAHYESEPDTWICGSIFDLLQLSTKNYPNHRQGRVEISGDVSLGQHFQQLLKNTEFYWEELLVPIAGDIGAHKIRQSVDAVAGFLNHFVESLSFSSGEFLQEELKIAPTAYELNFFISGVENLRDAVGRLEARLLHIENK